MPLLRVSFGHDPCQFSTIGCFSEGWNLDIFKVYDKAKLVSNNSVTLTTYHWVFFNSRQNKKLFSPALYYFSAFLTKTSFKFASKPNISRFEDSFFTLHICLKIFSILVSSCVIFNSLFLLKIHLFMYISRIWRSKMIQKLKFKMMVL